MRVPVLHFPILCLLLGACDASTRDGKAGNDGPEPDPLDVDDDGDGFTENEGDCDDTDASARPDGDEGDLADGGDDDCNGIVDDRAVCPGSDGVFETVQAAIDGAPDGFTLVVCPGTWAENVVIADKSLVLWAEGGAEVTALVGDGTTSVVTISDSERAGIWGFSISEGRSAGSGGGVSCSRSVADVQDCLITGNTARQRGGGVAFEDCDGTIFGNLIADNTASLGGGLSAYFGDVSVESNEFLRNAATSDGSETFAGNPGGGGGLFVEGDADLLDNLIEANTSTMNGGGFYTSQSGGDVIGNTVRGNVTAGDGGGGYASFGSGAFSSNVVDANQAGDDAGGMRVYVGDMLVSDCTFTDNIATDDGGALKLSHSANTLTDCVFEGNVTGDAGGGAELDNDDTVVTGCTFTANSAYRGAGLHSWANKAEITVQDSVFQANSATWCGGALQIDSDAWTVHLVRLAIWVNTAGAGPGLCAYDSSVYSVRNVVFALNTASGGGGTLVQSGGTGEVVNAVFHGNDGGVTVSQGTTTVLNTIVNANGSGIAVDNAALTVSYSDVYGNDLDWIGMDDPTGTGGNISADPTFADSGGDFQLQDGSPCIDAGDPSIDDSDGSRSDMGAYGGPDGP